MATQNEACPNNTTEELNFSVLALNATFKSMTVMLNGYSCVSRTIRAHSVITHT